ncbi:GNAT superfamily N-acetyltransferase [Streptomyces griseochromogenes]|uniref:GNAT superfamily N-acetyltransferase n=1 Tax=Streptomyces griseochromogenes TaxID=68214 RepID=A0ABS4M513_9ACTN|nr:GNAT family N-acetyltransferase [Streptomyces griseochromogenes]MBP2054755.1 GNAT superfamily N-acetyltransferase [Streptomyces griseochromogenes]
MTNLTSDDYVIRAIRPDEWAAVKQLRLSALQDPAAHIAFLETYEDALGRPDSFYQERAKGSGEGATGAQQFIAQAPDGTWVGTVTVLIEESGTQDWAGYPVERRQGHVVGVFVRPEHRGNGLIKALFDAGAAWAWQHSAERVRLLVHEDNARAQGAYRKAGFAPSGVVVSFSKDEAEKELEFVLEPS